MQKSKYDINEVIKRSENTQLPLSSICKELGYPYKYIHRILKYSLNYNVPHRKRQVLLNQKKVDKLYQHHLTGVSIEQLSNIYGYDCRVIKDRFKFFKYKTYKFKSNTLVNHTYFDSIDSEDKAYLLGFFAGDGSVHSKRHNIAILIQKQDVEVLNFYKKFIVPEANLYEYKAQTPSHKDRLKLVIHSPRIKESIVNHGIPPNKTYEGFSNPDTFCRPDFYRHFIRGFFDADGSIYKSYRSLGFKLVCTNKAFLNFCEEQFLKIGCTNIQFEYPIHNKAVVLKISNRRSLSKIKHYFYNDATYFLQRKFKKFDELV